MKLYWGNTYMGTFSNINSLVSRAAWCKSQVDEPCVVVWIDPGTGQVNQRSVW